MIVVCARCVSKGKALASIFLSYARDDLGKAQSLAKWLERVGHSVWWDRHIHGGSEYAEEIEAALNQADIVIVLWSEKASHSAWVRDEAAEGRDSGRLIPLTVDASPPPLGFRQLQSISLSGWSGRGNPPDSAAIKAAIAKIAGGTSKPVSAKESRPDRRWVLAASIAALLVAAAAIFFLMKSGTAKAETPVIAVMPFSDLSPEGNKAYLAEGVAEAILTGLAKEPGIKVIGRSSARQLNEAGAAASDMRRAMGITHVLEGSARSIGDQLRMSVRLVNASDGNQLWAEEYARRLDNIFAVQDEIGRAVAVKLRGSLRPAAAAAPITKADVYALYLAARSKMRDRRQSSLKESLQLAKRVIDADPNYAPGHALFAELNWHLSVENYGATPHERARAIAERHARRAIQLAPESPDGYAALGLITTAKDSEEPLRKAIALDPARAELRNWLGHSFNELGRNEEALEQFRSALEMEPLLSPVVSMVSYTLAASERYAEAEQVLVNYVRRGGSVAIADKIRGDNANYRGDYSEAARLTAKALAREPETPQGDLSASWFYYLLGMPQQAEGVSKRLPPFLRLALTGQSEQLRQEVRRAGPRIWEQAEPFVGIEELANDRDWRTVVAIYDADRAQVQKACADGELVQAALTATLAHKNVGRTEDARKLLACTKRTLELQSRGPVRSAYLPANSIDWAWAEIHAIEGRPKMAFALLDRAINRGFRSAHNTGLSDYPVFDPYKSMPEYARIHAKLKRLMAQDRAEAVANLRRTA